jgi:hypothetical protein
VFNTKPNLPGAFYNANPLVEGFVVDRESENNTYSPDNNKCIAWLLLVFVVIAIFILCMKK